MVAKQQLADQLKAQSEIWRAQVKDYQERLEQMGEQARSEYKKTMEQMQAKAEEAHKLAEQVRGANEAAWNAWSQQTRKLLQSFNGAGPMPCRVSSDRDEDLRARCWIWLECAAGR